MELFEVINKHAMPSVHALMIEPFKSIWERDTSDEKGDSIRIFTYIELLCSPRKSNPFAGLSEEDRPAKVKKEVFGDENYQLPLDIMFAILKYKELLSDSSPSYDLYTSGLNAVHKLKVYLDNFSLDERTPGGAMVMKPKDLTSALRELPEVAKMIELARDKVHSEVADSSKTRSQRVIGLFEE